MIVHIIADSEIDTNATHTPVWHHAIDDVKPTAEAVMMMRNTIWQ